MLALRAHGPRRSPLSLRRLERPAAPRILRRCRRAHRRCRPRLASRHGGALAEREAEAARGCVQRQGRVGAHRLRGARPQASTLAPLVVATEPAPAQELLGLDLRRALNSVSCFPAPGAEGYGGHDDGQSEHLAEDRDPLLGTQEPRPRPERGGEAGAQREYDHQQVRARNAQGPGGEPPDLSLAKPTDAEVAIAREPEKIPGGGEEEEHREEVGLALP